MGFRDIYNKVKAMPAMGSDQAMKLKKAAMMSPVGQMGRGVKVAVNVMREKKTVGGKKGIRAGAQVMKNYMERNSDR